MPEGSKAMCIKNRLMRRAAAGTPWAGTKETPTKLTLAVLKYFKTCGGLDRLQNLTFAVLKYFKTCGGLELVRKVQHLRALNE